MSVAKPKPRPTISDVARLAGVSISTVSRVVNDTAPVSPEVAERVRGAVQMLSYTPHQAARNLAVRRTDTVGLLLPELSSNFFAPMLRGVEAAIRRTDYHLLVYSGLRSGDGLPDWRRRVPIGEHNTDGMLIFVDSLEDEEIVHNYQRDFPMVLLFRDPPPGVSVPTVMFDNRAGVQQAIEHLVMVHDRRRIVFLRGPVGNQESELREATYRESLQQHGIPYDPDLVARGGFNELLGQAAIEGLLRQGVRFDAVFAGDDDAATGVLLALRQAGLRVPENVAVVGFDDLAFSRHVNPPLTTVRAPIEQAGYLAAMKLLALLGAVEAPATMVLQVDLVIRQSCGCP